MKKRKLRCGILLAGLAFSLLTLPLAARAGTVSCGTQEELAAALAGTGEIEIDLTADVSLTAGLTVPADVTVTVRGNGHTISMEETAENYVTEEHPETAMLVQEAGSSLTLSAVTLDGNHKSRLLYVAKGASLTLSGGTELTEGKTKASNTNLSSLYGGQILCNHGTAILENVQLHTAYANGYGTIYNDGTVTMEAEASIRDVTSRQGGGIYNDAGGSFTMEGGTIDGANGRNGYGGAVTNFGAFTMAGGTITGSSYGVPAVYNVGTFYLKGGAISGNKNTDMLTINGSGGTFYNGKLTVGETVYEGTAEMTGGSISDNTASNGGGVVVKGGTFTMDGENASISGNTALYTITSSTNVKEWGNGGGVFVVSGEFILKEGSVTENAASCVVDDGADREPTHSANGGGIYLYGGKCTVSGGSVTDNQAAGTNVETLAGSFSGGAVYLKDGTLTISGGTFSGNQADTDGTAGIYLSESSDPDYCSVTLSGAPVLRDGFYLSQGALLTAAGTLTLTETCPVYMVGGGIGGVILRYASGTEGTFSEELLTALSCEKALELSDDQRSVIFERTDLSTCTLRLEKESYTYTGKQICPELTLTDPSGNVVTAYHVSWQNNIEVGTATLTLTGDSYTTVGTIRAEYEITEAPAETTTEKSKEETGSTGTTESTETQKETEAAAVLPEKPAQPRITFAKNKKKGKVLVKWKWDAAADGYQLVWSKDKTFTKGVKTAHIKKGAKAKQWLSGLKKNKKYYIRIRSYVLIGTKGLYSDWSGVRKVRVRK